MTELPYEEDGVIWTQEQEQWIDWKPSIMLGGNPAKVAWLSEEPTANIWWEEPRPQPRSEAKWVCEHLTNEIW